MPYANTKGGLWRWTPSARLTRQTASLPFTRWTAPTGKTSRVGTLQMGAQAAAASRMVSESWLRVEGPLA
jgi:hypothetical protein